MLLPSRPLHSETQRHVALMSVHNDDHIHDLDLLIRGLHDAGVWDRLTLICVAGPNEADSLLDLKGAQNSVKEGSPVFTADTGFATVGTTDIINTQLALDSSYDNDLTLSVYTQDAGGVIDGIYIGETAHDGTGGTAHYIIRNSDGTLGNLVQGVSGLSVAQTGGGFKAGARVDASTVIAVADETVASGTSAAEPWRATHYDIRVGTAENFSGLSGSALKSTYSHWSIGKGMSASLLLAYDNLIKDYLTRRGTAV